MYLNQNLDYDMDRFLINFSRRKHCSGAVWLTTARDATDDGDGTFVSNLYSGERSTLTFLTRYAVTRRCWNRVRAALLS